MRKTVSRLLLMVKNITKTDVLGLDITFWPFPKKFNGSTYENPRKNALFQVACLKGEKPLRTNDSWKWPLRFKERYFARKFMGGR